MSDAQDESLTPPEARVRTLLAPLRHERVGDADELVSSIARTVRWQRPLRRTLATVGTFGAALLDGLTFSWRTASRKR